jgi:nucleotide-binding universal stress UspA family protein
MKPILIATDFSSAAQNAADYAVQLSKITASPIFLFHAWSLPVMSSETLIMPVTMEEIEKSQITALNEEAKRLKKKFGVKAEIIQRAGFASDEIVDCAAEIKAGMVVLGTQHKNKIGRILGSVATTFIHKNKIPALLVPENSSFSKPSVFLFATDLHISPEWKELDLLSEMATEMKATIHILNAVQENQLANVEESVAGIRLEGHLKNIPHSWHFPDDGDVVESIVKTGKEISADWIAVIPHRLSWVKQLFHKSIANRLAFETDYPILALPEQQA